MKTLPQATQNLSLGEFLVAVSSRDLQWKFVVPNACVTERLMQEIGQRVRIESRNLAGERGVETAHHCVELNENMNSSPESVRYCSARASPVFS